MSVKVVSVSMGSAPDVSKDVPHVFKDKCLVVANVVKADVSLQLVFNILPGFKTDGLSVPKVFRKFLPCWDKKNGLYNLAGAIHDGLYANKGFYVFKRSECDDIFRGLLRESGICRFKASSADWCVGKFAGGDSHWGNDSYHCKDLIKLRYFTRLD